MAQAGISVSPLFFCDHYYVDVLLRYYYARAKELQVPMSIHASLPEHPGIAEENLCVVLGKLLENALEASVSAPNKHPHISVSMAYRDAVMAIEIQNTYTGELIGIFSIRSIAERYQGDIRIQTDPGNQRCSRSV